MHPHVRLQECTPDTLTGQFILSHADCIASACICTALEVGARHQAEELGACLHSALMAYFDNKDCAQSLLRLHCRRYNTQHAASR